MKKLLFSGLCLLVLSFLAVPLTAQTCNLPAPANLHFPSVGSTQLTVAFDAVPGATQYRIDIVASISTFNAGTYYTNGTTYTIGGLQPGTQYAVSVSGGCPGGGWGGIETGTTTTTIIINEIVINSIFPTDPGQWPTIPANVLYFCLDKQPNGFSPEEGNGVSYLSLRHVAAGSSSIAIARARIWADHLGQLHVGSGSTSFSPPPGATLAFDPVPQALVPVGSELTRLLLNGQAIATIHSVTVEDNTSNAKVMFTLTLQPQPGGSMHYYTVNAAASTVPCLSSRTGNGRAPTVSPLSTARVAPNPFTDQLAVQLDLPDPGAVMLELVDARGRSVLRRDFEVVDPAATLTLETGTLDRGMYMLRVETPGGTQTYRIIKP